MIQNNDKTDRSDLKELVLILAMFPAMGAILVGPIMIFWPVFLSVEWLYAETLIFGPAPTVIEWALSPFISLAGVLVTYAVFRLAIELDRGIEEERQPEMGVGYLEALEDGEIAGFVYIVKLLASKELALKVLRRKTPDSGEST